MKLFYTLALLLSATFLCGQTVKIQVLDSALGTPQPEMTVVLDQPESGVFQTGVTNAIGQFTFRNVPVTDGLRIYLQDPPDDYFQDTLKFATRSNFSPEFQLYIINDSAINLDEIAVTATRGAQINRSNAEVSFELKREELKALPVEGRDITRALFRLPNVSQATGFFPEAPNVAINGANALYTSYLLDGMDNNERFLGGQKFAIPVGFTQNITVLTNNFSAEYGNSANGIVNVTTRSGSNEFTGEAFAIFRPGTSLDGDSDFPQRDLSGNFVRDGFSRYQGGFGIGGPIVKDKTFFYLNYEYTQDVKDNQLVSGALGVDEVIRGENEFQYASAKIDHHWNNNWRSSLRGNLGLIAVERQGGGLSGGVLFPSAGDQQDRNSAHIALENSYVASNWSATTAVQYSRFRWNYAQPFNAGLPQVTIRDNTDQTVAIIGHPGYQFDETENTIQAKQSFSFFNDRHTRKVGVAVISADHQLAGGGNPNGNYTVQLTDDQLNSLIELNKGANLLPADLPADAEVLNYAVELRPSTFGTRQTIYSVFVEDEWAATAKLNLTLGLRYDYDDLSRGGSDQGDLNNIAPRLNFNYKLNKNAVIRGGYGIFYDKILYAIHSDALQQNTTIGDYHKQLQSFIDQGILPEDTDLNAITFNGNFTAGLDDVDYLQGPGPEAFDGAREGVFSAERRILNPNGYDNPYAHQFSLGFQQQINRDSRFFVDVVHNRSYDLFRLRNLNAPAPYIVDPENPVARSQAEADLTRPVAILPGNVAVINGETVSGVARNVVMTESDGQARYYGLSMNYEKAQGTSIFSYRVNYTLSYLENNTEDINFRAMDSNDFEAEWGPSINDRRHIFNGIGTIHPTDAFSVTVAALVQSGQPINRIPNALAGYPLDNPNGPLVNTTDLNGDGSSFGDAYVGNSDRFPGVSRNSDRLPWGTTFDLAVNYRFNMIGGDLLFRADVFNILNTQNWSGYSNNATASNQIQVGPADAPIVRRNAGAPRQFQFSLIYQL